MERDSSPLPAPPAPHRSGPLLERDAEVAAVGALVGDAAAGDGRVLVVEGPAGIGKSRLVAEVRRRADAAGLRVLHARGSELERDFGFGVVRQLFEGSVADEESQARLLTGPASAARQVVTPHVDPEAGDGTFAALHGLHWLTVHLARDAALAIVVDDLHWCDRPSLRFLAYLARRLEGLPVLLAVSLRPAEPGADAALLAEIANDPAAVRLRPAPLTAGATGTLIEARLGEVPERVFAEACHRATGGNPLLLTELAAAMRAEHVAPDAASAGTVVREVGPRAVARAVGVRLRRVPPGAVAVARAVAVLGDGAALTRVAELAHVDEATAAAATGDLVRAEILRPELPLGFVHPLVRAAVYHEIAPGDRGRQHLRAARLLLAAGAPAEQTAAHLLTSPPGGEGWARDVLRDAARTAAARGAAESAVAYMRRALEERADPGREPELLLELGLYEGSINGPAATASLRGAYEALADPALHARAAAALVKHLLMVGSPAEARAIAERELARGAGDQDLRDQLEANRLSSAFYDHVGLPLDDPAFLPHRRVGATHGGARMLAGVAAYAWAMTGASASDCVPLGLHAVGEEAVRDFDASGVPVVGGLIVLMLADHPEADRVSGRLLAEAERTGSLYVASGASIFGGLLLLLRGHLAEADLRLRVARDLQDVWGQHNVRMFPASYHAEVLVERGDLEGARRALEWAGMPADDALPVNTNIAWWLTARLRFLLASGDHEAVVALSDRCAEGVGRLVRNPAWLPWRSLRAEALHALGRVPEARRSAEEELEAARAWGAPGTVGRALRVHGALRGDVGALEEAVALLEDVPRPLEHAKALAALGTALRLARRPTDAREPLRRALELATVCEAAPLAERVRGEIYATGARPRVDAMTGVAALTASERRVADLAVAGATNREIAQALYVTPKTVEVHLSSAYRKLGIRSRRELPAALAA